MVKFDATPEERVLVQKILDRLKLQGEERENIQMDLIATHANGCQMNFEKLATADSFCLMHDVVGIARHLDRDTGKLTRCFLPRCAA